MVEPHGPSKEKKEKKEEENVAVGVLTLQHD